MTLKNTIQTTLIFAFCIGFSFGCKSKKKVYTATDVQNELMTSVRKAEHHRRKGKLDKASQELLATGDKILKDFPQATLRFKTVKRFLSTSVKIGNLCLDRGHELQQEAVSNKMWKMADVFKNRFKKHQEINGKIRKLLPELKKAEVSAKAEAASAVQPEGTSPRPASTTSDATEPARPAGPASTDDDPAPPIIPEKGDDLPPIEDPKS